MNEAITETPTALVKIIESSGLDKQKSEYLLEKFNDLVGIAAEWEKRAKEIVVTDESQTDLMKQAREGRLLLKEKRVEVEKTRKQLKDASLKEGRAIDSIAGFITSLIEPTEKYLDEQEKFAERKEAERIKNLNAERLKLLEPYIEGVTTMYSANYGAMPQQQFDAILLGLKTGHENKVAAEKKAEEERIAKEKADAEAREAQRIENERLRREAEEGRKAHAEQQRRLNILIQAGFSFDGNNYFVGDLKRLDHQTIFSLSENDFQEVVNAGKNELNRIAEQQVAERKAAEAQLKAAEEQARKAREESEKAANELRLAKEKLEREKQEREEQQRQAELAPDRQKLETLATELENYELPELKSAKAKKLAADVKVMIATAANHIRTNIKKI